MKKLLLFLAFTMVFSIKTYSQIMFENGYYIDESDQKIDCLIKNIDWRNNPIEFEYMLSQDSIVQKASIETVKEFGINGVSKYIRSVVNIDRSSDVVSKLSYEKNPNFQEEQLFLKVLIEGKASLYLYESGNLKRFFFNVDGSEIKQLVYLRYLHDKKIVQKNHTNIVQNNYYKQQLFITLQCQGIIVNDVEKLRYVNKDLELFFIKYNECFNSSYINYEFKEKKDLFNLTLRPGLNYSKLGMKNSQADLWDFDFDNKLSYRLGIEAEIILPFNKNKWSLIIEPTYQYYNAEKTTESSNVSGGIIISKINYQSLELPIGIRHCFFLNEKSKIFADITYIFDYSPNSIINLTRNDGSLINSLDVKARRNLGLGVGYKYNDRFSLGIKYYTNRDILSDYISWKSNYRTMSVIFGYTLF
jgi:hypothetical protein